MQDAAPTTNGTTITTSAATLCGVDPENLSTTECQRVEQLKAAIDSYYEKIPRDLKHVPALQERCLEYLLDAERALIPPLKRKGIIQSRLGLTRVEMEIRRALISNRSFMFVALLVYLFALTISLAFRYDILAVGVSGKEMNAKLIMGIPLPIMVWSFLGSMTSMLLRAGQLPFSHTAEALRWLLFRPIVGMVMGVLTYLMVTAGLLVFAGTSQTQTPELLWIIAFIGSFSDTLSITLLQKIVGTFQPVEAKGAHSESSSSQPANLPKGAEQKERLLI
jgi:hypothetical protein